MRTTYCRTCGHNFEQDVTQEGSVGNYGFFCKHLCRDRYRLSYASSRIQEKPFLPSEVGWEEFWPELGYTLANRPFGIEIECVPSERVSRYTIEQRIEDRMGRMDEGVIGSDHDLPKFQRFQIGEDCTVNYIGQSGYQETGFEIRTPILAGLDDHPRLEKFCKGVLRPLNIIANNSCGMHTHVNVRDMNGPQLRQFVLNYCDSITAIRTQIHPDRWNGRWCPDPAYAEIEMLRHSDPEKGREKVSKYFGDRGAVASQLSGYGTIEFRQHHGSTNWEEMKHWSMLLLHLAETSKKLVEVKATNLADLLHAIEMPAEHYQWYFQQAGWFQQGNNPKNWGDYVRDEDSEYDNDDEEIYP